MGFNIIAPYVEFLHLNWYIAEWYTNSGGGQIFVQWLRPTINETFEFKHAIIDIVLEIRFI